MRTKIALISVIFVLLMLSAPIVSVSSADDGEDVSIFTSYYAQLDDNGKAIYDELSNMEASMLTGIVELPNPIITTDTDDATEFLTVSIYNLFVMAFEAVSLDNPMAFCTWGNSGVEPAPVIATYSGNMFGVSEVIWVATIDPAYADDPETADVNELQEKIDALNAAVEDFSTDATTSKGIFEAVNRFLTNTDSIRYDPKAETDEESPYAHDAYGALVALTKDGDHEYHYAVCDGYSEAFQMLCMKYGTVATSAIVTGMANQQSTSGAHAWNVVKIDDYWYGVDSTWNVSTDNEYLFVGSLTKNSYGYTFAASHSPGIVDEVMKAPFFTPMLYETAVPGPSPTFIDEYGLTIILIAIMAVFCIALVAMAKGVK